MTENLTRKTAKIFADNAPQTAVGQFGSALNGTKVNTSDIEQIQALPAYETGWTSAVVTNRNYPTLEETNGVMKVMSYQTAYTLQKGVPEWDAGTTYFSGDMCKAVGSGVLYVSRSDNNLNNPVTDNTYWREYSPSASELPATNYISEMAGSAAFNGDTVTLPAMTLYIPNGRSGNNTLVNQTENLTAKSYTLSNSDGEYTLFYNNETQSLHLAPNYTARIAEEPELGNNGDVWYSTNNKMYMVQSTNPNYVLSDATVSTEGTVSGLGTLSFSGTFQIPQQPVFNLNFTTGSDVTTAQSLFSTPYAAGSVSEGNLNIDIYSTAYGVSYHPIIYTGAYTLQGNETLYSFTLGETTVYSSSALQLGLVLYTDDTLETEYGTVTELSGESITVATITTVYDGTFSLVTSGTYYTYLMGSTNYYTSEPLANGVTVYTDTTLETVFGIASDVEGSNVLIQSHTNVYTGAYTTNPEENIYTYTIGDTTVYSSGVLIPGLIVYSNKELTTEYGVCETVTTTNVVIHSIDDSSGYVAASGTGAVPANVTIYSDVNLQAQVATSTGANATYTSTSAKSTAGTLTYELTASTQYSGTLSFNSTSYVLVLNSLSTSLLSSRLPYTEQDPAIVLGGSNGFLGTFDLSETNMPNVWTWNGFNTTTPDWVETQLCKLGKITILGGDVTALNIDYPIELVKMSDLDNLNLNSGGSSSGSGFNMFDLVVKDHILSFEESKGFGLQGTYVYKDAVTGSRYGYPDFYNKCVEEKTASVNTTILTTPNVTNQGCYISRDYIVDGFSTRNYVQPSTGFNPESNPWEIVTKFITGSSFNNYQGLMGSTDSAQNNGLRTIIDANGSLLYYGSSNNSSPNLMDAVRSTINLAINTTYYLKAEYTGTQYIFSFSTNGETYTPDTTVSQTTPVSIRSFCFGNDLWSASNQYPFLGSIDLTGCYIKINDEIVWQGVNSLNLLKNSNGHYFYDIADKDAVDEFYQENGEAWFYGVDTTNERIFLPRTTRFQYTSDTSKVGACQEAGLPDIEGTFYQYRYVDATGAFKLGESKGVDTIGGGGAIFSATNTSFEASRSNPIYGNSETVTPAATNQLLYIVVGNTEVESAATDVVDVTTTENDTIPLFTGMYYDFTPNNPSWLKAGEQANNGGLYVSAYSKLVNELTDPVYNLKVIDVSDMESNVDYSEYWKVDQDAMTFTTPTRMAERILVARKEPTDSDPTWYNWYSDGWLEQGGNLNQSGSATVTYPKAYIDTNYTVVVTLPFNDASSVTSHVRTDTKTVNSFSTVGGSINGIWWQTSGYGAIPSLSDYTEDVKLYFKVANAVENMDLIDLGEITEALADKIGKTECKAYVTEAYQNGTSGYMVYSNGLCEQWGYSTAGLKISFIKPYKDTNYAITMGLNIITNNIPVFSQISYTDKTADSFVFSSSTGGPGAWRTIGYIS